MKNEILKDYLVNKTIDIDKIIDDFYGYVYMITKNGASIYITDEDIEEIKTMFNVHQDETILLKIAEEIIANKEKLLITVDMKEK